jgi:hypothetical protein
MGSRIRSLVTGLATLATSGCLNPTQARIVNDLDDPVRLRLCDSNDCSDFHPPNDVLPSGEDMVVSVSEHGVPNVYLVESEDESRRYGCLPLVSPETRPGVTVFVSEHVPCRNDVYEDAFWPPRWGGLTDAGYR